MSLSSNKFSEAKHFICVSGVRYTSGSVSDVTGQVDVTYRLVLEKQVRDDG